MSRPSAFFLAFATLALQFATFESAYRTAHFMMQSEPEPLFGARCNSFGKKKKLAHNGVECFP
ncbi:MAG: hypothetical protein AMJ61_04085 [Desulfobacterales bacterium SG8_35_2]|jgi:hypothetical protein|nr:MAG: hypothetical protein AMJ61_04085 [Desulfobacterales bacterium SG8_35_2]